jgi:hypothetical protein
MYPKPRKPAKKQSKAPDRKIGLLELIILVLTLYWLLSFFGQSIVRDIAPTGGFIDMLSIVIVVLIIMKFLSQSGSHTFNLLMVVDIFRITILS